MVQKNNINIQYRIRLDDESNYDSGLRIKDL